jgi:hypothetical protein
MPGLKSPEDDSRLAAGIILDCLPDAIVSGKIDMFLLNNCDMLPTEKRKAASNGNAHGRCRQLMTLESKRGGKGEGQRSVKQIFHSQKLKGGQNEFS